MMDPTTQMFQSVMSPTPAADVTRYTPDPARVALEELVAAVEGYLAPDIPMHLVGTTKARLTLALNAARNALHMGKVLDSIASDPDIVRGHTGSYG